MDEVWELVKGVVTLTFVIAVATVLAIGLGTALLLIAKFACLWWFAC